MNDLMRNLGLCRRAGKLVAGYEPVREAARKREAKLVLRAGGISAKTHKEIGFFANKYGIELAELPMDMLELAPLFHKRVAVMAITDVQFANLIRNMLNEQQGREHI